MRGLPGTLAPMYQESVSGQQGDGGAVGDVQVPAGHGRRGGLDRCRGRPSRMATMQSATHSTCCSMETAMLESTEGLPGPVMVKRLGNPSVIRPR